MNEDLFKIGDEVVKLGERKLVELHIGRLYDFTELTLSIMVLRGKSPGPTLFLSGGVHGDEVIGVAILRNILRDKRLRHLKGTLLVIPVVNVFGFNTQSRYLPDRRDLNRCFPGSEKGSLASRIAHIFMKEIVKKSQYGIDFHSGAIHRSNLPQIRCCLSDPVNKKLVSSFGVPVVLDSKLRDGSLRQAAHEVGVKMLLFEGGEALRVDNKVVRTGVQGAFSVMGCIGMLPQDLLRKRSINSYFARSSYWVRSPEGGFLQTLKGLGHNVKKGTVLGVISDTFGRHRVKIVAPSEGIVIGMSNLPLVNRGDAVFHIATFEDSEIVRELAMDLYDYWEGDRLL